MQDEIKEDFCPSCLVVPLAFAGASATAAGKTMNNSHKKMKQVLFVSGIITIIITLLVGFYYLVLKEKCTSCTLPVKFR
jgi:hypothetical protein